MIFRKKPKYKSLLRNKYSRLYLKLTNAKNNKSIDESIAVGIV
jgi:hypothetical protein